MSVVNVKVKYIRPKYNNLKEWMDDSNNVYIGRKGIVFINGERYPKKDSIWANPFRIDKINTREDVIYQYENYLKDKIDKNIITTEMIKNLKGKNLGCWCVEDNICYPRCHGDIIIDMIKNY